MPVRPTACLVIACAECGLTPWEENERVRHFATLAEAKNHLRDWRWEGDIPLLCPPCTAEADCVELGHEWSVWHPCRCGRELAGHRDGCPEVRWCRRCGTADYAYAETHANPRQVA